MKLANVERHIMEDVGVMFTYSVAFLYYSF